MEIFQTLGLVICVGGVLVLVLGFFLFRRLTQSRKPAVDTRREDPVWNKQGSERPRYDSSRVESSGGFGNAPTTTRSSRTAPRTSPRTATRPSADRTTSGRRYSPLLDRKQGLNRDQPSPRPQQRPARREDDDDIRSGGGFGG